MFISINSWWTSIEILEKIFWIFAIVFSLIFIIQLILSLIGIGFDTDIDASGDADLNVEADSGIGFQFISFKNFIAFFTIFGWTGVACINSGFSTGLTIFLALVFGVLMMLIMAGLFYLMGKLTESGNAKIESAIGKTGTVYLTIPSQRSGKGKVQIDIQGLKTLDAISDCKADIKTGGIVKVVGVEQGEVLIVESV